MANKIIKKVDLPKLPYGEGSMSWCEDDKIIFKKSIVVNGRTKRIAVYGKTPKEAMLLMREKEAKLKRLSVLPEKMTLSDSMLDWLVTYKKAEVKASSFDRLMITYKNQINSATISKVQWNLITPKELQQAINDLAESGLAWSTIKKAYDLYGAFYSYKYSIAAIERNPMDTVRMTSKDNVLKPQKEIQYLSGQQIDIFCNEAKSLCKHRNLLKYPYGPAFVFIIYTGLRIGELCALQWKDIDFENKTVSITKNLDEIVNKDYDETRPWEMKEKGITRYIPIISSTKTRSVRLIALNQKAIEAIELQKKYSKFADPDDYVVCSKNRKPNTPRRMDHRIKYLLKNVALPFDESGCHMLRHTCASLLFAKKIQVEIIASILGHSPDVCRSVYIHFCQQQQASAIHKITEFEI